jgi:hypothetical protein
LDDALGLTLNRLDVDFHLPNLEQDSRLAFDPFLLFKSRHHDLVGWHERLMIYVARVVALVSGGRTSEAVDTLTCPEPNEVRLGYTAHGTSGSGIGRVHAAAIAAMLESNPDLLSRGLRHVEELQLYSVDVGADRLSDLAVNVLKQELVEYTQRQATIWGVPLQSSVGLAHAWDHSALEWVDLVADLPVDPETSSPIVLVPRRVLRRLPWINYEDFRDHHLFSYLPSRAAGELSKGGVQKRRVVELTRRDLTLVNLYVDAKEETSDLAEPVDLDERDKSEIDAQADDFEAMLSGVATGEAAAHEYENLVLRILNSALGPDLIDGRPQQRTYEGTQIRDLIFVNDSDHSFWQFMRQQHAGLLVVFEVKNKDALTPADLNQLHAYLGDSTGYLGFVVSRQGFAKSDSKRAFALYNKRVPRSVILSLSDQDLVELVRWRKVANGPTERIRETYRSFMTQVQ